MTDKLMANYRTPNTNEKFVLDNCIKNTKRIYIELLIIFLVCDIALWCTAFIAFTKSVIIGFISVFFAVLCLALVRLIWKFLESSDAEETSSKIFSASGIWSLQEMGASPKTKQLVSSVDGESISMMLPDMAIPPKEGEEKKIEYEYAQLFDSPPVFGHNTVFISIDGRGITEIHVTYLKKIMHIGVLSIITCAFFLVLFMFCLFSGGEILWLLYLTAFFSLFFIRVIFALFYNRRLRRNLMRKGL